MRGQEIKENLVGFAQTHPDLPREVRSLVIAGISRMNPNDVRIQLFENTSELRIEYDGCDASGKLPTGSPVYLKYPGGEVCFIQGATYEPHSEKSIF